MDLAAKIKAVLDAHAADDHEALKAASADLIAALAAPGSESTETPIEPLAADPLAADPEPAPAKLAALSAIRDLTGCAGLSEAVALLSAWKADRDAEEGKAKVFEDASRLGLVSELVKLNVETPATAWTGEGKDRKLVARLSAESVADMRNRIAQIKAARGPAPKVEPPESTVGAGEVSLSAETLAQIKAKGLTVEQFLEARKSAVKRA